MYVFIFTEHLKCCNSPGEMTMEEPLPHEGNTHHYMHGHVIYCTCVIIRIDEVEKTGLVYSSIPTGCGTGIPGPDVKYEEVTGSMNAIRLAC